jgi:pyruvate dehydrogenase (quinone)
VQIDVAGRMVGLCYPTEVNLVGDSAETLRALLPMLEHKQDRSWREEIEKDVADWWKVLEAQAMEGADPINPQRVYWELSSRLPDNCILTADSGSGTNWSARDIKARRGMMGSLSGGLETMGPGIPYAIAAKFAFPDRPVIALVRDGAMQMNGNGELMTVANSWKEWDDPRFVVMVLNNRDLNQVTWEMRVLPVDPKFPGTQELPDYPFAQHAELLGFQGIRIDQPDQIGSAPRPQSAGRCRSKACRSRPI